MAPSVAPRSPTPPSPPAETSQPPRRPAPASTRPPQVSRTTPSGGAGADPAMNVRFREAEDYEEDVKAAHSGTRSPCPVAFRNSRVRKRGAPTRGQRAPPKLDTASGPNLRTTSPSPGAAPGGTSRSCEASCSAVAASSKECPPSRRRPVMASGATLITRNMAVHAHVTPARPLRAFTDLASSALGHARGNDASSAPSSLGPADRMRDVNATARRVIPPWRGSTRRTPPPARCAWLWPPAR